VRASERERAERLHVHEQDGCWHAPHRFTPISCITLDSLDVKEDTDPCSCIHMCVFYIYIYRNTSKACSPVLRPPKAKLLSTTRLPHNVNYNTTIHMVQLLASTNLPHYGLKYTLYVSTGAPTLASTTLPSQHAQRVAGAILCMYIIYTHTTYTYTYIHRRHRKGSLELWHVSERAKKRNKQNRQHVSVQNWNTDDGAAGVLTKHMLYVHLLEHDTTGNSSAPACYLSSAFLLNA
jgi:hypothetical protein